MSEIEKQLILEKVSSQIDSYKKLADELFLQINVHFDKEKDRFINYSILVLQRYYSGLNALSQLINKFKFNDSIEMVYAIIMRTLLLDYITIEYLYAKKQESDIAFKESLKGINYLSAMETKWFFDKQTSKDISDFKELIINNFFPENFEKKSGDYELLKTKTISPYNMAKYFQDKKETYAYDAYKVFNHYSLIAHLNNMTISAMKTENDSNVRNLLWSLFYIFHGHDKCLLILDFFPKQAMEIINKRDYFLELINKS